MKYRKKPVVVDAIQWFKDGDHPSVLPILEKYKGSILKLNGATGYIETWERKCSQRLVKGGHFVTPGDWIIKGIKGEFYVCKPDIFGETYEKAEEVKE